MEPVDKNQEGKVKVKVSELVKKFKTKQDIMDYCRENGKIQFLYFRLLFPSRIGI